MRAGIKQLGDSLSASMSASWSTSPTITKVLAYCAATLGVLLLVRSPKPAAVQQGPRKQGPPAMVPVPGGSSAGQGPGAASTPGLWDKGGALGGFLAALGAEWQQAGQAPQALPPQLEPPLQQQQAQAEAGSSGGAGAEGCRGGQGERALEPGAGSQQGPGHSAQVSAGGCGGACMHRRARSQCTGSGTVSVLGRAWSVYWVGHGQAWEFEHDERAVKGEGGVFLGSLRRTIRCTIAHTLASAFAAVRLCTSTDAHMRTHTTPNTYVHTHSHVHVCEHEHTDTPVHACINTNVCLLTRRAPTSCAAASGRC